MARAKRRSASRERRRREGRTCTSRVPSRGLRPRSVSTKGPHRGRDALADEPPQRVEWKWRLTEMTLWEVDAMDLVGPAFMCGVRVRAWARDPRGGAGIVGRR